MILALAAAAMLAVIAYGVLAGADFGAGVWDVLARGPLAEQQRRAIAKAMGPVWEANHVWLIFLVVVLFTAFPPAYAQLSIGLFVPFHLVLVGIELRGGAFVFRHHDERFGVVFGGASTITPVLLGMCMGAVSANLRVTSPMAVATGALALAICAYLAAVYLTLETEGELREAFRTKALWAGGFVVALSAAAIPLTATEAPHLFHGLLSARGAPVIAIGGVAALASGWFLLRRRFALARVATIVQVAFLLGGWGAAQYPYLIYPSLTLDAAASPPATLAFVLWTLPLGLAIVVPSLVWLFRVFKR